MPTDMQIRACGDMSTREWEDLELKRNWDLVRDLVLNIDGTDLSLIYLQSAPILSWDMLAWISTSMTFSRSYSVPGCIMSFRSGERIGNE